MIIRLIVRVDQHERLAATAAQSGVTIEEHCKRLLLGTPGPAGPVSAIAVEEPCGDEAEAVALAQ